MILILKKGMCLFLFSPVGHQASISLDRYEQAQYLTIIKTSKEL